MDELISISEAARIRGVTHSAIQDLIERNRLASVVVAGRRLLKRSDVVNLKEAPRGRPPKPKDEKAKVSKKGGKK